MLGEAPGTERLSDWVQRLDDGMSLEEIANHIAGSSAFRAEYPNFDTNRDFAEKFLGNLMGDEDVSAALMAAAVDVVVGLLNDGMTRGALALAVVGALQDINTQGAAHPAHADLGAVAARLANQIEVAEYYTLDARMADPSSGALDGVTSDAATVATAKQHIDSPPADAMFDAVGTLSVMENADGSGMPGDDNAPISAGYVTASDSNGDDITYSIEGDPADWMILQDGKLCYVGAGLDYEAGDSVSLNIVATSIGADGTETSVVQSVDVMVGDVQESDAVFADAKLAIDENETTGAVGSVTATDAEGDAITYRLADGSPDGFSIDEETGAVSYEGEGFDYETQQSVDLTVIATSIGADNMATDVSRTFTVNIGDVDDLPDEPMDFVLTPTLDDFTGGDADDTFIAQPVIQGSNIRDAQETLNAFDRLDGGGGTDTIYIYGVDPDQSLNLGPEEVRNIENVVISTVGGIDADLTDWEGVTSVDLRRFGRDSDVTVIVDEGAVVSGTDNENRPLGGDVTIVGSAGDLSINAGGTSEVHVGSAGHTATVTVTGGGNIMIDNGAGKQSQTVTSVSSTGVAHNTGSETQEASGTFVPLTDANGFVVGQDGSTLVSVTPVTSGTPGTAVTPVGLGDDGATLTNAITGAVITGTYSWDDDGDGTDTSADPAQTGAVEVVAQLKFDAETGRLVFGDIVSIGGTAFSATVTEIAVRAGTDDEETYEANALDGMRVPASVAFTSQSIGKEDAAPVTTTVGGGPTLTVNSDAIADVTLASTTATILVHNNSMTDDKKAMPEDLSITLDEYGTSKVTGKLCVAGSGSAENIMLTVAGDSWVDLNSNVVKMLDVNADAKLSLSVSKFDSDGMPDGASETLESVMVSGEGAVSMNSLGGMKKLASIDASGSSGNNSFKSDAALAALASVMGGSGNDTVSLAADEDGKLESIMTGDGNDSVMISGDYREDGLMVDLGDGDDSFDGNAGNSMSRVDGGAGRDTLTLSSDGATYKDDDDKDVSIYSNFEILDVGGGSGTYNVGLLGVDTIIVNASTTGTGVELDDVAGGISLSVSSSRNAVTGAASATSATIDYDLADDVNSAGSLIDGNTASVLNVSLMAVGGKGDSKAMQTGEATLTLDLDTDLMGVIIDSNAGVHGTAAGKGASSGRYQNEVEVTASSVEEVKITGNAQTKLHGAGLTGLEYVNAAASGGGVEIDASVSTMELTLIGSQQDDTLTAGTFAQTLTDRNTLIGNGGDDAITLGAGGGAAVGGAGGDTLTGAGGTDLFVINSASESQVTFKKDEDEDGNTIYKAEGYDTIENFTSGTDKLHFSKALHAIVTAGEIVGTGVAISNGIKAVGEWAGWMPVDTDGDPTTAGTGSTTDTTTIDGTAIARGGPSDGGAGDLRDFIGSGKGLFLTSTTTAGPFGNVTRTYKNSIAVIDDNTVGSEGLWLLVDVDADGDFDAATDMVIFLAGAATAFDSTTDISTAS